jgi:hypothetical protein
MSVLVASLFMHAAVTQPAVCTPPTASIHSFARMSIAACSLFNGQMKLEPTKRRLMKAAVIAKILLATAASRR